jgi:Lar family restriction alleviation protein
VADNKTVIRMREKAYDLKIVEPGQPLRSCPFCDSKEVELEQHNDTELDRLTYCAVCLSCAAIGPWDKTKSGAIRGWNGYGHESRSPTKE